MEKILITPNFYFYFSREQYVTALTKKTSINDKIKFIRWTYSPLGEGC